MATTPVNWEPDDEWELINDDGFVYKRRKRPRVDLPSSSSAPGLPDPAVEEQNRRQRKKRALLKLKHKYQQEIEQWVHLSNTLKDMQQNSRQPNDAATSSDQVTTTSPVPPEQSSDSACRHLADELLLQAEAQKSIIEDVARLCDVAEALCSAREENFTKSFTELPVWASKPHELMTSLYED
ncbi:uncharacterized protein LOC113753936 [Coffea eugenioides]|uniref:uncharacterized protein LOC113753936 n=1 Tax=Coffea eugenioides TaxID=49369 RepID=UPI000F606189|nr:uncharacterized protein LOC113753936 [Coffea eugenioides]